MNIKKLLKKQQKTLNNNCIDSREKYISSKIPNIGKIIEDDEKITCFVEQDLLDKNQKSKFYYEIRCHGLEYWNKSLTKKFNLNKPIYYIFDGIIFEKEVKISSLFSSHLVFKNCTFTNEIKIFSANDITLENNKYIRSIDSYDFNKTFIYTNPYINIKNLTIYNDNFINSYELKEYIKDGFGINVIADNLSIINSHIYTEGKGTVIFKCKNLNIMNSKIEGKEVYIEANSISSENSTLASNKGIMIENKDNDCNMEINTDSSKSSIFIYNGIQMKTNQDKKIIINQETIKLQNERLNLLNKLKQIKDKCNSINEEKINELKNDLESKSITKTLKR